ncbi:MAG: hypothetical protein WAL20_02185 [Rhodomicrobium sp.]
MARPAFDPFHRDSYALREKRRKPLGPAGQSYHAKKIPHKAHWTACGISVTEERRFPFVI